jgi:hypothetical protein
MRIILFSCIVFLGCLFSMHPPEKAYLLIAPLKILAMKSVNMLYPNAQVIKKLIPKELFEEFKVFKTYQFEFDALLLRSYLSRRSDISEYTLPLLGSFPDYEPRLESVYNKIVNKEYEFFTFNEWKMFHFSRLPYFNGKFALGYLLKNELEKDAKKRFLTYATSLIEMDSYLDLQDEFGKTPLHYVVHHEYNDVFNEQIAELLKFMIGKGANRYIHDNIEVSPIAYLEWVTHCSLKTAKEREFYGRLLTIMQESSSE